MKYLWFIPLGFIAIVLSAQSIDAPSGITIFNTSTLTNITASSTAVDVQGWDSVSVIATVPSSHADDVAKINPQWSNDNTSWVDQPTFITNSISGRNMQFDMFSRQITLQMTNAALGYVELFPRQARYFRVQVKSTNIFTVGTINITVQKMNNGGKP